MDGLPVFLLADIEQIPRDRPVAILMRHSARFPILRPEDTFRAGLTEEGVRMAERLGRLLGERFQPGRLLSAPVGRCSDTAAAIARGAGWPAEVLPDERLSHPFIAPVWRLIEHGGLAGRPPIQVRATMALALGLPDRTPRQPQLPWPSGESQIGWSVRVEEVPLPADLARLDVLVTHDTIVGAVVTCLGFERMAYPQNWPDYLEGIFVWRSEEQVHALWRGVERVFTEDLLPAEG